MTFRKEVEELGKSAAESVFGYVARTAEAVEGGIRWQTLNGRNQPH